MFHNYLTFSRYIIKQPYIVNKFSIHIIRFFYDSRTRNDTIFAPATAIHPKEGSPLGVIRVSGARTGHILENLTDRDILKNTIYDVEKTGSILPRRATLTKIFEPGTREVIDLGLVIWFPKPNSYTGEDVCEFHLHGSRAIITKMLTAISSFPGLRPAEPGEFTRRAVQNSKMSLIQAEGLSDLIKSQTDKQRQLALKGLDGSTRFKYDAWAKQLVGILAHLEASIDFGEDELIGEAAVVNECTIQLKTLVKDVEEYIKSSERYRCLVMNGVQIAILGKPNTGKSTFMNLFCKQDLSIVSDLCGTTRDLIKHSFELGGHSVTLCDTAGLKEFSKLRLNSENIETEIDKHHLIEQEGIKRAICAARKADILIYLVDANNLNVSKSQEFDRLADELKSVMEMLDYESSKVRVIHVIINKIDLNVDLIHVNDVTQLKRALEKKLKVDKTLDISFVSCKTKENFNQVMLSLISRLDEMGSDLDKQNDIRPVNIEYVNQRHLSLLESVRRHLELASGLDIRRIDEMAQHVRESVDYLSRIVGSISNDEVIDIIFKDFCIGK